MQIITWYNSGYVTDKQDRGAVVFLNRDSVTGGWRLRLPSTGAIRPRPRFDVAAFDLGGNVTPSKFLLQRVLKSAQSPIISVRVSPATSLHSRSFSPRLALMIIFTLIITIVIMSKSSFRSPPFFVRTHSA